MALTGALGWGMEVVGGSLVLLQVALLILFAPSLAAGLVSAERESGYVATAAHDAAVARQDPARQAAERRLAAVPAAVRHAARLRGDDDDQAGA